MAPDAPSGADPLARFALPIDARVRFTGIPAISPDGSTIVFPANEGRVDTQQLYVRRIDQIAAIGRHDLRGMGGEERSPRR